MTSKSRVDHSAMHVNNKKREYSIEEIHRRTVLMQRGFTTQGLAHRLGVSQSFISMLISGKRRSQRIETQISKLLGISRKSLWS